MVRVYKKKETGGRRNYCNSQNMIDAYKAVINKEMSVCRAAKHFGVAKRSLLQRVSGHVALNAQVGRQTSLPVAVENELVECIKLFSGWGWRFTYEEVKDIVQQYVVKLRLKTQFTLCRPGRDWMEGFLKRHPDVSPLKSEYVKKSSEAEDMELVNNWFDLLDKVLEESGIKDVAGQIFNVAEIGFVTDPTSEVVLTQKCAQAVEQCYGSGKGQITVNCAASASGQVLPPYVIYQAKNMYHSWTEGGPEGAVYTTSNRGWIEGPQFEDWFERIFLKYSQNIAKKQRVLIFDGYSSQISVELAEKAKNNNVILLRLPAHLTHLLQPFSDDVIYPVKAQWQYQLLKFARFHTGSVGKKDFPKLLRKVFRDSIDSDTIKAGFKDTGVCPYDKHAVRLDIKPQATPTISGDQSWSKDSPQTSITDSP